MPFGVTLGRRSPSGSRWSETESEAMKNILDFPDKKGERERSDAKMEFISNCDRPMGDALKAMRELGANNGQIIKILRRAVYELERSEPPAS
jgi:hypothetical protein